MGSGGRHALREALQWTAALLLFVGAVYFYDDLVHVFRTAPAEPPESAKQARPDGFDREVRVRADEHGHFTIEAKVNDQPLTLLADTGATLVVLTFGDAQRLGLSPHALDYSLSMQTANGIARVAPVVLERVRIDDILLRDVAAAVAEKGALGVNLLGMSFLKRLQRFEVTGRELVLVQ